LAPAGHGAPPPGSLDARLLLLAALRAAFTVPVPYSQPTSTPIASSRPPQPSATPQQPITGSPASQIAPAWPGSVTVAMQGVAGTTIGLASPITPAPQRQLNFLSPEQQQQVATSTPAAGGGYQGPVPPASNAHLQTPLSTPPLFQLPHWSAADVVPATLGHDGLPALLAALAAPGGAPPPPMPTPAGADGQQKGWRAPRSELSKLIDRSLWSC
jgi:hypothetical protein